MTPQASPDFAWRPDKTASPNPPPESAGGFSIRNAKPLCMKTTLSVLLLLSALAAPAFAAQPIRVLV
jgi:hypothetical protein